MPGLLCPVSFTKISNLILRVMVFVLHMDLKMDLNMDLTGILAAEVAAVSRNGEILHCVFKTRDFYI